MHISDTLLKEVEVSTEVYSELTSNVTEMLKEAMLEPTFPLAPISGSSLVESTRLPVPTHYIS